MIRSVICRFHVMSIRYVEEYSSRSNKDTAPALEAPDTEHTGGSKSRAGIKFRRNERSMDGGIPPEN